MDWLFDSHPIREGVHIYNRKKDYQKNYHSLNRRLSVSSIVQKAVPFGKYKNNVLKDKNSPATLKTTVSTVTLKMNSKILYSLILKNISKIITLKTQRNSRRPIYTVQRFSLDYRLRYSYEYNATMAYDCFLCNIVNIITGAQIQGRSNVRWGVERTAD
jgi:hypothetical protein